MLSHPRRHLNCRVFFAGVPGGDWNDQKLRPMLSLFDGDDDDDGPVFGTFLAARLGLAVPEIGISENVSRSGNRP